MKVLSKVFRGKFVAGLRRAFRRKGSLLWACRPLAHEKAFSAFLRTLFRDDWVVYAKQPFGGPEHVLHYLARYTHRVAISNHRLVEVTDTHVTFRWKDYAHHSKRRTMTLAPEEFLRRFLQHVFPGASLAFATSAFSPIAGAVRCFLSAARCWRSNLCRFQQRPRPHPSGGSALAVRDLCA